MIESVRREMAAIVPAYDGNIGLFLSGGSDSLLLLLLLIELKANFRCITLDHTFTREQHRVIDQIVIEYGIRVFSYPPSSMYLIGDGGERVTLVEEYKLLDGSTLPMFRDAAQDDRKCVYDADIGGHWMPDAPVGFKLNLFGTRRFDRHYALGRLLDAKQWSRGPLTFYAPLYDLTRTQVKRALADYGHRPPTLDTGEVPLCTKCLTATGPVECPKGGTVNPIPWEPRAMLETFRETYDRRRLSTRNRQPRK